MSTEQSFFYRRERYAVVVGARLGVSRRRLDGDRLRDPERVQKVLTWLIRRHAGTTAVTGKAEVTVVQDRFTEQVGLRAVANAYRDVHPLDRGVLLGLVDHHWGKYFHNPPSREVLGV